MALERLTQITEVGIKSGITLRNINVEGAYVSGVITATTLTVTNGFNVNGVVTATSFNGNVTGSINPTSLNVSGVSTFNANVFLGDGDIAYFGDGQDLLIFHNSTDSIIRDNGTGDLYIEGGNRIRFTNPTALETYAVFNQDGASELYYDNVKKLETTSSGVSVSGGVTVSGVSTFSGGIQGNVTGNINSTGLSTFSGGIQGNVTGNINSTGVSTFNNVVVGGATTALVVNGDARVTGILTIGTSSITIDGTINQVNVGTGVTIHSSGFRIGNSDLHSTGISLRNINASGVVTATTFVGSLANNLTLNTSGTGLSGSTTYNNSGASTFTVTSNATNANTGSAIVARDASGNFSAGTITATLSGNSTGLSGTPNITVGSIIASSAVISGNVSVAGTVTYEDVTNVDSVGVITARSGIVIGTGASISSPATNVLTLGTNNAERVCVSAAGSFGIGTLNPKTSLDIGAKSDAIILPSGTDAQRPGILVNGMMRYNTSTSIIEGYIGNSWRTINTGLTPLVQNGLVAALDASDISSYPGSGTTIYDISGTGSNGTINNTGVTWVSSGTSSYFNFPSQNDAYYIYQSSGSSQNYTSFTAALFIDSGSYSTFIYALATSNTSDLAFRISGGTVSNPGNANDWASSATTYYYNGAAYTTNVTVSSGSWFIIGGTKTNGSIGSFSYNIGGGYTGRHWVGRMGAFYLYNRALTASEQTQNYNALRTRFGV